MTEALRADRGRVDSPTGRLRLTPQDKNQGSVVSQVPERARQRKARSMVLNTWLGSKETRLRTWHKEGHHQPRQEQLQSSEGVKEPDGPGQEAEDRQVGRARWVLLLPEL